MTSPESLREWLSADGRTLTLCEVDLRVGGSYRYEFSMEGGRTFNMGGTYREVVPDTRIVNTEAYDGYDWEPLLVTTLLQEGTESMTRVTVTVVYPSKEICERDFPNLEQSGAVYCNLAALLATRAKADGG